MHGSKQVTYQTHAITVDDTSSKLSKFGGYLKGVCSIIWVINAWYYEFKYGRHFWENQLAGTLLKIVATQENVKTVHDL